MPKSKKSRKQDKAAPPNSFRAKAAQTETLEDLLRLLKISPNGWDYLVVSDGSGVGWDMGCGWASTLVSREPQQRLPFNGGMHPGTVSLGEIMGFMQPLMYLASKSSDGPQFQRIHVVSDSQYVVQIGNALRTPKSHAPLWRQLASFRALGMQLQFHWIPRDSVPLNKIADLVAGVSRKAVSGVDAVPLLAKLSAENLDELNPSG